MTAPDTDTDHIAVARAALLRRLDGRSAAQRRTLIDFAVEHYGGAITHCPLPNDENRVTLRLLGVVAKGETEDAAISAWIEAAQSCTAEVPA